MASPVHVGCGQVRCAHGILPVPAPATAYILQGVPTYGGSVQGELCTPTGAALLKHFVQRFGSSPVMRVEKTGYGMGKKDFEAANCVRAMLGQTPEESTTIAQLACNLDDMTPEALGFAQERLWEAGALDVTTAPIGMKKNRPGVQLTCLCRLEDREKLVSVLFAHTTTLGVRESLCAPLHVGPLPADGGDRARPGAGEGGQGLGRHPGKARVRGCGQNRPGAGPHLGPGEGAAAIVRKGACGPSFLWAKFRAFCENTARQGGGVLL